MADKTLPPTLRAKFGHLRFTHYTSGEWHAECPVCSDFGHIGTDKPDRFIMFDADGAHGARGYCRRCGHFEWADVDGKSSTAEQIQAFKEERARLAAREQARLKAKIEQLQREAYWQGWHDAMGEQQRRLWRDQGIADSLQDWFKLGYVEERQFSHCDELFTRPALTIPHFEKGWNAINVQYRLINPPNGAGKYRYTPGLPAPLYLTEPDEDLTGPTILVEGAKKAIVLFAHLATDYRVVAVPSKAPSETLLERLGNCDPVYVILDPDAYAVTRTTGGKRTSAIHRLKKLLGDRAIIVKLPVKPDDFITLYGGTGADIRKSMEAYGR